MDTASGAEVGVAGTPVTRVAKVEEATTPDGTTAEDAIASHGCGLATAASNSLFSALDGTTAGLAVFKEESVNGVHG